MAKVNYSIAEVIAGKLELIDYQTKIGQVLAENFADLGDWQVNLADYGLAATDSQRKDNYVQTSNNPQIGSLAMTFDLNKGQIQYQGFPISSTSAATAGVRARAEGLLEYGSPRASGSMGGYNIGSAYTVDANNLAQATDTASQTTVALAKFGNAWIRNNTANLKSLFGTDPLLNYDISNLTDKYKALNSEQSKFLPTNTDSITVFIHGIGKPLNKGDKDLETDTISPYDWEEFVQGTFPSKNEKKIFVRWNTAIDYVPNGPLSSLSYYLLFSEKIKGQTRAAVVSAYNEYVKNGKKDKINFVCHSLGSIIMYEVLKEAETTGLNLDKEGNLKLYLGKGADTATNKYFTIDKFIAMGAVIKIWNKKDYDTRFNSGNVNKFVNIWSPQDIVGSIYGIAYPSLKYYLSLERFLSPTAQKLYENLDNLNGASSGSIINPDVINEPLDVPHASMWLDIDMIHKIGAYYGH